MEASHSCLFHRKMEAYILPLNPCSNGPLALIDVKCLRSHAFSEDRFSKQKQRKITCLWCLHQRFCFDQKTNALNLPVMPVHLRHRQPSALKSSIPCGDRHLLKGPGPLSCLELMSISVFLFLETMSNCIGLVIKP